jgi:hypothetical protein
MASRKELAVGQVRELRSARRGDTGVPAKVEILALDQTTEFSRRDSIHYTDHNDMVLVKVLEPNDWHVTYFSNQMDNERALVGQKSTRPGHIAGAYRKRWQTEKLPEGQYLVKPKLLGPVWDEEEKQAQAKAAEEGRIRREKYQELVRAQDQRIQKFLETAQVQSTRWSSTSRWQLTSNDLAKIIETASLGEISIGEVHWSDVEKEEV